MIAGKTYHKVCVTYLEEVLTVRRLLASARENLTCKTRHCLLFWLPRKMMM